MRGLKNRMEKLIYEDLVKHFEDSLLVTLRAHSAASEMLEFWVPDPDIVSSIVNMIDGYNFDKHAGFTLEVQSQSLSDEDITELQNTIGAFVNIEVQKMETTVLLTFKSL